MLMYHLCWYSLVWGWMQRSGWQWPVATDNTPVPLSTLTLNSQWRTFAFLSHFFLNFGLTNTALAKAGGQDNFWWKNSRKIGGQCKSHSIYAYFFPSKITVFSPLCVHIGVLYFQLWSNKAQTPLAKRSAERPQIVVEKRDTRPDDRKNPTNAPVSSVLMWVVPSTCTSRKSAADDYDVYASRIYHTTTRFRPSESPGQDGHFKVLFDPTRWIEKMLQLFKDSVSPQVV